MSPSIGIPVQGSVGIPVEGTIVNVESLPVEGTVVSGETILETSDPAAVQSSPSDSTVTSDIVEPPVAADSNIVAPGEEN